MKKFHKHLDEAFEFFRNNKIQLTIVLFYAVFREKAHAMIDFLIVDPIMSSVREPHSYLDWIFGLTLLAIGIISIYNIVNNIRISFTVASWSITIAGIYSYERYSELNYTFVEPKHSYLHQFAYLDLISALGAFTILQLIFILWSDYKNDKLQNSQNLEKGFFTDFPVDGNEEDADPYDRVPHIKALKEKIINTNSPKGAFAIGIIGKWGSGKTSFLNKLHTFFKNERTVLQMHFNPWMVSTPEKVIEVFFSELSNLLSKYDGNLKSQLSDYTKELLKSVNYNNLNIANFFSEPASTNSLSDQSCQISKSISNLRKKIIVYVDDVDRLDKKESVEVLRLVRNTANFSNTFFLVAFDRTYLLDTVRETLSGDTENYLEKIFQLEFYLPIIVNNQVASDEIRKQLPQYLGKRQKEVLNIIFSPAPKNEYVSPYEATPRIYPLLENIRDAKRFINIFNLEYKKLENNVYLPDYLNICILRLKFPEVYYELYHNRFRYLEVPNKNGIYQIRSDEYRLKVTKGMANDSQIDLMTAIKSDPARFSISAKSFKKLELLLTSIFDTSNAVHTINRSFAFSHQTIVLSNNFSKYFDCFLANRLDQNTFNSALESNDETFFSFVENTARSTEARQLKFCLEGEVVDNKDEYERLVKGMFLFADTLHTRFTYRANLLSTQSVIKQMGGWYFYNNYALDKFYNSKESYKSFLYTLMNKISILNPVSLLCRVLRALPFDPHDESSDDEKIIPRKELIGWCQNKFYKILDETQSVSCLSVITFQFIFDLCPYTYTGESLPKNDPLGISQMAKRVRKLAFENSIENVINTSILKQNNTLKCTRLHRSFKFLFSDIDELWQEMGKLDDMKDYTSEFISYYNQAKDLTETLWVDNFSFKHLIPKTKDLTEYYNELI